jgi:hypothetical protein
MQHSVPFHNLKLSQLFHILVKHLPARVYIYIYIHIEFIFHDDNNHHTQESKPAQLLTSPHMHESWWLSR